MNGEKSDLLTTYKNINNYMKSKADSYEGHASKELVRYREEYIEYSDRDFETINPDTLIQLVSCKDIIYMGDFHTFDQNSRNFQRILKSLNNTKQKIAIGLEVVHYQNQEIIEQFLNRFITELEFLDMINYKDSWKFPWNQYKLIFDFAKAANIEIIALNSTGELPDRDKKAASIIKQYYNENENTKLLVFFGEYHILPNKIPFLVNAYLGGNPSYIIIHQNLDIPFWKLNKDDLNFNQHVLKFNDKEFSLQTSPPWIKYESLIYWYENLYEDPEYDIHEYMIESGMLAFNANAQDTFLFICQKIKESLSLTNIHESNIEDFNLYDYQKISIIIERVEKLKDQSMVNFYKKRIEKGRIFKIPYTSDFYCSSYSLNRVSYLAGIHLLNIANGELDDQYENIIFTQDKTPFFIFYTLFCLFGYFCSKIMNPYRKCDLYKDLKNQSEYIKLKQNKKHNFMNVIKVLDLDTNESIVNCLSPFNHNDLYAQARITGHLLGDIIYDQYYKTNHQDFSKIKELLFNNNFRESNFKELLKLVLPDKSYQKNAKRFF